MQYVTFYADGLLFGIRVDEVQEILRSQAVTPVPLSSPAVEGLVNLRGTIVTAIDVRTQLELAARPHSLVPAHVIVRGSDGPVSLVVDQVGDVIEVDEAKLHPVPETLVGGARERIAGAFELTDRLLLILRVEEVARVQVGSA